MKTQKLKVPSHLSDASKKLWRQIVTDYEIDVAASLILATMLEARDRKESARATLAIEGTVQVDRFNQRKPHPCVVIEATAATVEARNFRLLGFDQEARGSSSRR